MTHPMSWTDGETVRKQNEELRNELLVPPTSLGKRPGLKRVLKQVEDVAGTDATVLILGETGTGKELIARAIHSLSPRRDKAFVRLELLGNSLRTS